MKILLKLTLLFSILLCCKLGLSQWNPNLNENLHITNKSGDPIIIYSDNGYYFCYSDTFRYKVNRYDMNGVPLWPNPISPYNHDEGTATYTRYCLLDHEGNLINASSFNDPQQGTKYTINKITSTGEQLWNGSTGIIIDDFVVGIYYSSTNYLYVGTTENMLLKYDTQGNLVWKSTVGEETQDMIFNCNMYEKKDGSLIVTYFSNSFSSYLPPPPYGHYGVSKISQDGVRLTQGKKKIHEEFSKFYSPSKMLVSENEDIYFVFSTQNFDGYIQKLEDDNVQFPDNGLAIDDEDHSKIASSFMSCAFDGDDIVMLYHYFLKEQPAPTVGIKHQKMDLQTMSISYPKGLLLYFASTNSFSAPNSINVFNDDSYGFLLLNGDLTIDYVLFNSSGIDTTYKVCTTKTNKGRSVQTDFHPMNADEMQSVVLFEDFRNDDYSSELYAQNIIIPTNDLHIADNLFGEDQAVTLFPIPAKTNVHISSESKIQKTNVLDLSGKIIRTVENNNVIEVSTLSNGIYFFNIYMENGETIVKKVIIQK